MTACFFLFAQLWPGQWSCA